MKSLTIPQKHIQISNCQLIQLNTQQHIPRTLQCHFIIYLFTGTKPKWFENLMIFLFLRFRSHKRQSEVTAHLIRWQSFIVWYFIEITACELHVQFNPSKITNKPTNKQTNKKSIESDEAVTSVAYYLYTLQNVHDTKKEIK